MKFIYDYLIVVDVRWNKTMPLKQKSDISRTDGVWKEEEDHWPSWRIFPVIQQQFMCSIKAVVIQVWKQRIDKDWTSQKYESERWMVNVNAQW